MDVRLERYLDAVAASLSLLPARRRDEELREMRTHLENAVIVHREWGQTEDEAAATAVEEFGSPAEQAEGIVRAWRRGRTLNRRSFLGAAITAVVLVNALPLAVPQYVVPFIGWMRILHSWPEAATTPFAYLLAPAPVWWLMGWIVGRSFPRKAVAAAGAVLAAGVMLQGVENVWGDWVELPWGHLTVCSPWQHWYDGRLDGRDGLSIFFDGILALAAMRGAWVASRRQRGRLEWVRG